MSTTTDREIFDRAASAKGMPSVAKVEPVVAPEQQAANPQVKPEEIWRMGQQAKDRAAEKAKSVPRGTPEPEAEPERALDGKFTSDDKQKTEFDEAKYELARNALHRSGWKKAELDAMEPTDLIKRGLKRAAALDRDDEAHRIAKETRERKEPKESKPDSQPVKKPLDLTPILAPLSKSLALDEEGASTLKQTLESFAKIVSEETAAPLREQLSQYEKRQAESAEANEAQVIQVAQAEVGKRFPDLLDPETFSSVLDEVRVLANSKMYQRIANPQERVNLCFADACKRLELREEESDGQSRAAEKEQRSRSRSTVSDRTRPEPVTPMEHERKRFDDIAAKHGL